MAVKIADTLKAMGNFPVVDTNDIKGGYYQVDTIQERDNIPESKRKIGMLCWVAEDDKVYKLKSDGTWIKYKSVGSGNIAINVEEDIKNLTDIEVGTFIYVKEGTNGEPAIFVVTEINEQGMPTEYKSISDMIKSTVPKLSYTEDMPEGTKLYKTQQDDIVFKFKFSSDTFGNGNYKIYRDGILIKSFSGDKGTVIVNLGKLTVDGNFSYTITATDYLGIPAPETLKFDVICGGLKLTSTFDKTIEGTVFEVGDSLVIPYSATCSDKTAEIKLDIKLTNITNGKIFEDNIQVINSSDYYTFNGTNDLGRGLYKLEIQGYTGESINDETLGTFRSDKLEYSFSVITKGEIAITNTLDTSAINSNTYIQVPFKIVTKVSNFLLMRGKLYKKENEQWVVKKETPTEGKLCMMNVTDYWALGILEEGNYKIELTGYTRDGGMQSLENSVTEFYVEQASYEKVKPITANLLCYFDANEKRNSDAEPNVWYNNKNLDESYRILLHNLNYTTNGWKHVDENIPEEQDGEMMLKFTGDTYGELVKVDSKRNVTKYSPFSIFKNAGVEGITIETVFRTRCVGEMKSKVLTCQEGNSNDTPGIGISYDKMYMASDIQTIDLDFAEDEWVHATFVIDKNIRTLEDVGQESIENINPYPTMRIYINGCLCLCTQLSNDKFLDAGGNSFPLMLNACWQNTAMNFGESEIKFLRIYNTYFTSENVLHNYIASIYDIDEQKKVKDKNDLNKITMPTVYFKRNKVNSQGNETTFTQLHTVTQKSEQKKVFVNCTMEIDDGNGNIDVYSDVDVLTQGTSSLQYPLKNYKIKCYQTNENGERKKLKIIPRPKKDEWAKQYTYTLKCDYMESSHRNNTPIATFYDKVLDALSAQSPSRANGGRDSIDGFPCIVYISDDYEKDGNRLIGTFMFNLDKTATDLGFNAQVPNPENPEETINKMISLEGTANASDTAGCFFKFEESINNVYQRYVEESYEEYIATNPNLTLEEFKDKIAKKEVPYDTFEDFLARYTELDYVASDWDPRYSYAEEEKLENDTELTYRPMLDLINWVSDSTKNGTFKKDFEKHLDLKYCIAYALQMMMFAQVDNCGKNAMFDTWDGIKWYPRPYDMDTCLGLSNSGTETINTDAEIIPDLSPTYAEGTYGDSSNNDTVTANRYLSYNTKTSKLWNNFFKEFKEEIAKAYRTLRSKGIYTVENIMKHQNSLTIDCIGEIYYNKDAGAKYLSQASDEYLKMLHGNRTQKVKQFLTERIIFLDTFFNYSANDNVLDSLNSQITLRSDAFYGVNLGGGEISSLKCYLGISVYSPQYVTVNVGSGRDNIVTAYVSPKSTYIDPETGRQEEGTLFSFSIKATDKEMIITGAGNIKNINKLEDLNVRDLTIANAKKILKLNLSSSTRMTALTLGENKFLKDLDCSHSYLLGTGVGAQSLDLSGCRNLRNIDISYTKLTGLILPQNSNIETINVEKSTIKGINVDGMEFLRKINIDDCNDINSYTINNCSRITEIDVSNSSIKSFAVTNCKELSKINVSNCKQMYSFDVTGSNNITSLNMNGNTGQVMNDLQLYTLYNLEALNVGNTTSLTTIRLPKYANSIEADKASRGEPARLWNNLKSLTVSNSSLKYIQYGSADIADDTKSCDMSQLGNLTSLSFSNCNQLEKITNLKYVAYSVNSLFSGCGSLKSIQGTLTARKSANSTFAECFELSDIDNLILRFNGVTDLGFCFKRCLKAKTSMIKKVLDATNGAVTKVDAMCEMWDGNGQDGFGYPNDPNGRTLPSNLFENCPNINNANLMFFGTGYTTIPGDLLDPCATAIKDTSAMFARMPDLTSVGSNLLKNKPNLQYVQNMFAHAESLEHYIDLDSNIFNGSPKIVNVSQMFINSKLQGNPNRILEPLTELTNAEYMFYHCPNITGQLPEGFFYTNTKLKKIDGIFARTGLTQLPQQLFRKTITDTNTFPSLTEARSVFSDCTNLSGIVSSNFFAGATEITHLGEGSNTSIFNDGRLFTNMFGFFANTAITGYHETILSPMRKLIDVSGLFSKNSTVNINAGELKYCYYYKDGQELEYNNSISENLFKYNVALQNVNRIFQCSTQIRGHVPPNIFKACKNSLIYANSCFYNCSTLNGINLDNEDESVSNLTGISDQWFYNASNLLECADFLRDCTSYVGSIPKNLFYGCTSLQKCCGMFYNDTLIHGNLPIELFNDCRLTLKDVSEMFYKCLSLQGAFPTGTYSKDAGVTGYQLCNAGEEGALQVVSVVTDAFTQISYSNVVGLSPDMATIIIPDGGYYVKPITGEIATTIQAGFLAECINLESTRGMFYGCKNLGVGSCLPFDIFYTSTLTKKYNSLIDTGLMFFGTGFDKAYIDENTSLPYLCDANMLSKCPNIQQIDGMFRAMRSLPTHSLYNNMFAKQVAIRNASGLFRSNDSLTGAINQSFLQNSLGSLEDVSEMFAFCNISSIVATFLNGGTKNSKLKYVGGLFYDNSNITGGSPEFWKGDMFSNIKMDEKGYYGTIYNCTKLSNYNEAKTSSENWTAGRSLNIDDV